MKYYNVKAHDTTDCGAACIATVCKQYGLRMSIAKIREYAGTDKQGTNIYGVVKALEELGFTAKAVKGERESLFTDFPLPCIAHVVVQGNMMHYVVIHKITKKYILIGDPGRGLVKLTHEEFFGPEQFDENTNPNFYKWSGILILVKPDTYVKKDKETDSVLKQYLKLILPQKKLFLTIFLASVLYSVIGIGAAYYFQGLIDYILPGNLRRTLAILSIGIILLNLVKVLLDIFRNHLMIYLGQRLDISILLGYYKHVVNLPMNFFSSRKVGEIISRFNDASKIREIISSGILSILIDILMILAGGILLFSINGELFVITLIMVLLYFFIVIGFKKVFDKQNRVQMEDNAQLVSYLFESINGIQTVKAYNAERKIFVKTEGKFIKSLRSIFSLSATTNIQNGLKLFVQLVGEIGLLWYGAIKVMDGYMTIGQLITFNALTIYFLDPIKNLIDLQSGMQTAFVATERLNEVMELETEKTINEEGKIIPKDTIGDIEFKNIDFRYGKRKLVLSDINLKINKGEKVAFVGTSGSGKTTLSKLLLNLYKPEKGEILIDGINISDINIEELRDRISYISQETFLFSGSIIDNLTLGINQISMEEVISAAKNSNAHDFINKLPLRYETRLEENGANLSGGQRQRLAITRALLKNSDIMIFDEATSNLDSITEMELHKTLKDICEDKTVIFIAHRLSTIKDCDKIFVMEDGKIVEAGKHDVLLQQKGVYSNLVAKQAL